MNPVQATSPTVAEPTSPKDVQPVERFIVFCGSNYYPAGGWRDYIGSRPTLSQAHKLLKQFLTEKGDLHTSNRWSQIVDFRTGKIVYKH